MHCKRSIIYVAVATLAITGCAKKKDSAAGTTSIQDGTNASRMNQCWNIAAASAKRQRNPCSSTRVVAKPARASAATVASTGWRLWSMWAHAAARAPS